MTRPTRPLRALAQIDLGRQRSPEHAEGPHMVPYLRAANVVDGRLELRDVKEMNFSPREQEHFHLRAGDVLVTEGSGSLRTVGASAVWREEILGTVCFQNTLLRLRPRDITDPRYLAWWCRHAYADGLFASNSSGANIFHLSAERLRALPVVLPSLAEQARIANFLDVETARIDTLIAKKQQLVKLLEERKTGLVEQRIRELVGRFGDRRLKLAASEITVGIVITPSEWYAEIGVPALRGLNVKPGRIDRREMIFLSEEGHRIHPKSTLHAGDVVVVRTGQAGAAAVVPEDLDGVNCIDLLIIRPRDIDPHYLVHVLNSDWTQKHIAQHSVGTIQAHFNVSSLAELPLPAPGIEMQKSVVREIDSIVKRLDEAVTKLREQISLLQEHQQALITATVTGAMEVPRVSR